MKFVISEFFILKIGIALCRLFCLAISAIFDKTAEMVKETAENG